MGLPGPGDFWHSLNRHVAGGSKAISVRFPSFSGAGRARALSSDAAGHVAPNGRIKASLKSFPLGAALTAGGLALGGDTIAQFVEKWRQRREIEERIKRNNSSLEKKELGEPLSLFHSHDFFRSLRMASYGFLWYGPFSHVWYGFLDTSLPAVTLRNFCIKVAANQVVLGPSVLTVIFAWNFLWMGRLNELGNKYKNDMWPTLIVGWKFWIPVAFINFGVVPLKARVAFMSSAALFWNFYLSLSIGKTTKSIEGTKSTQRTKSTVAKISEKDSQGAMPVCPIE